MQARVIWKTDVLCRGGFGLQDSGSVTSTTLVVIERECSEILHIYSHKNLILDLPGCPQISPNGPTSKGGNVDLLCNLEDPGHPDPSHFVWKK